MDINDNNKSAKRTTHPTVFFFRKNERNHGTVKDV